MTTETQSTQADSLLTPDEVAAMLRMKKNTMLKISPDKLKRIHLSPKTIRYRRGDVQQFIDEAKG